MKEIKLAWMLFFSILFISGEFFQGCNSNLDKIIVKPFKFMILQTSYEENKSKISLFNKDWNLSQEISLNAGGLGGILKRKVKQYKNRIYIIVLGATTNPFEKILEVNLTNGKTRFIKTDKFPTDLEILNDKLYVVHNTSVSNSVIAEIDLSDGRVIRKNQLEGVLPAIVSVKSEFLYMTAENPSKGNQTIYKLDQNLKVISKISNEKTMSNNDFLFDNNKLIVLNSSNANQSNPLNIVPTDQYLELDSKDQKTLVKLSKISPYQAFDTDSSILITHNSPINQSGYVTRINKKTQKQEIFLLSSTIMNSSVQGDYLYVLGNLSGVKGPAEKLYEYRLSDFKLVNTRDLPIDKKLVLSGIFINY
jgi:hypothetical protein